MGPGRYDYAGAGHAIAAAPIDAWRRDDAGASAPGYFEFDWLSTPECGAAC
ncbi:MAG TPA: hypothetical protein VKT30_09730 [Caulobacteraceae bacterium]|nr:hypothetical protein [Caulobacteraceae bacterium]